MLQTVSESTEEHGKGQVENAAVTLLTCSFSGDFEICKMMCESVERFVPADIPHHVYVPRSDFRLFSALNTERHKILAQEDLLPRWLWKVPMPSAQWRARLGLPRRNIYVTPYSRPVRGWIAQQMMKLEAARSAPTEIVVHVDSDNVLIRPFSLEHVMPEDERVQIYKNDDLNPLAGHLVWRDAARRLLGVREADRVAQTQDYIGQLVVWRRSVVREMLERIEAVNSCDWRIVLARTPHFSEYILYGVFVDEVIGLDKAGLVAEPRSLCHSLWADSFANDAEKAAFIEAMEPDQIACHLQSTLPLTIDERTGLVEQLCERAQRHGT